MFSKTQKVLKTLYSFQYNKFVEYGEEDVYLEKVGYCERCIEVNSNYENDVLVSYDSKQIKNAYSDSQLVSTTEILRTSIVRNPNSDWQPSWNPVEICE